MAAITTQEILDDIFRTTPGDGTRIVGIDGPSGSGKSTLARGLAELAGASIVQVDDFISWGDFAGWWPRFGLEVLKPLLAGRDARFQVRDWAGDEFGDSLKDWKTVTRTPLVIIEGVTCTRAETVGHLAYAIWVEALRDTRLRRGLDRDGESHRELWERWQAEEDEFFRLDGTRERADLILDTGEIGPGSPGSPDGGVWTIPLP